MAVEIDQDFKTLSKTKKLDEYYIPTRYPNGLPGASPSRFFDDPNEAETAMELTKAVIKLVERKIAEFK
ncbi:MAG: HEPN domain-containing protein [candidate division WOR-3 bacterium]